MELRQRKIKKSRNYKKEIDTLKAMSLTTFINNNDVKTVCAEYVVPFIALDAMSKKTYKKSTSKQNG